MKTFELEVKEATVKHCYTRGRVALSFEAEPGDVAKLLTMQEVVASFDVAELLDAIGMDAAMANFGLVPEES